MSGKAKIRSLFQLPPSPKFSSQNAYSLNPQEKHMFRGHDAAILGQTGPLVQRPAECFGETMPMSQKSEIFTWKFRLTSFKKDQRTSVRSHSAVMYWSWEVTAFCRHPLRQCNAARSYSKPASLIHRHCQDATRAEVRDSCTRAIEIIVISKQFLTVVAFWLCFSGWV